MTLSESPFEVQVAEEPADLGAWLAVAAGSIGAFMASLDVSIVNSALPTIQGEIGATGAEGTWLATAYLVAEIVVIPLSAWLQRLLGLRTLLLWAASLFTAFSIMCGFATELTTMVVGRIGQGFTGGVLIPTAITIVATRLPRYQQPIGNALFGVTAILGPVIGPLIGGWLTEQYSWHYAFFLNIPVGFVLVLLLWLGLPHEKTRLEELYDADWLGIIGLILSLGCLTVILEEGQREQWFESSLIKDLSFAGIAGAVMLITGQFRRGRPVINLRLLLRRQFGSVAVMGLVLGMVVYGSAYVIPQFLATIDQYDAFQSGKVVVLAGIPTLVLAAFAPLMIRFLDIRIAVFMGMLFMAVSCWIDTTLTVDSSGGDFTASQLLRGAGTILAFLFLNQAAITSVGPEEAGDAAGLFNSIRNIGGSMALAAIATVQDQRISQHSRQLEETMSANSDQVTDYLNILTNATGGIDAATQSLAETIKEQALVMTFNDVFYLLAAGILIAAPLVIFLRPLPRGLRPSMH